MSLGRLWLGNRDALTEVVWAEDGVFPLCIEKADFLTCLTDPFAGYLLFLPRLVAGVVAALPVEQWAIATNLLAALIAAVVAGLSFAVVRRFGLGWVSSIIIGLLPGHRAGRGARGGERARQLVHAAAVPLDPGAGIPDEVGHRCDGHRPSRSPCCCSSRP